MEFTITNRIEFLLEFWLVFRNNARACSSRQARLVGRHQTGRGPIAQLGWTPGRSTVPLLAKMAGRLAMACMLGAVALSAAAAAAHQHPPLISVPGYTVRPGDCGYPVCGTLMDKGAVAHKTMIDIAAICNATAGW